MMTPATLQKAVGLTEEQALRWLDPLVMTMLRFKINTPARMAAFLAQVGHESMSFKYTREIWGPTPAQKRYEGRLDLGNTQAGDGKRYMGRGLIQITGRANYRSIGELMKLDLINNPQLLEQAEHAAMSAGFFWAKIDGNSYADKNDFRGLTRKINGGTNGLVDRQQRFEKALAALS